MIQLLRPATCRLNRSASPLRSTRSERKRQRGRTTPASASVFAPRPAAKTHRDRTVDRRSWGESRRYLAVGNSVWLIHPLELSTAVIERSKAIAPRLAAAASRCLGEGIHAASRPLIPGWVTRIRNYRDGP